jgi:hypothetical protein
MESQPQGYPLDFAIPCIWKEAQAAYQSQELTKHHESENSFS